MAQEVWDVGSFEGTVGQSGPPQSPEQGPKEIKIEISTTKSKPTCEVNPSQDPKRSEKVSEIEHPSAQANNVISPVTPLMLHYAETRETDHFGFSGFRAAIACLYARPEGATQAEVNQVSEALGSPQKNYLNMLREGANKWRHNVVTWPDPARGGKVYKLIFNRSHSAPRAIDPPPNWGDMNVLKIPPGVMATPYGPRPGITIEV
jgi:hypothetical protein